MWERGGSREDVGRGERIERMWGEKREGYYNNAKITLE